MKTRLCWLPLGGEKQIANLGEQLGDFLMFFYIENPESMEKNPNKNSKMHPTLQEQQISARHQRSMGQKISSHWENQVAIGLSPIKRLPKKQTAKIVLHVVGEIDRAYLIAMSASGCSQADRKS